MFVNILLNYGHSQYFWVGRFDVPLRSYAKIYKNIKLIHMSVNFYF